MAPHLVAPSHLRNYTVRKHIPVSPPSQQCSLAASNMAKERSCSSMDLFSEPKTEGTPNESCCSPKSVGPSTKRSVTFATTVHHHSIPSLKDYTGTEISASWYSTQEKDGMRMEREKALKRLELGKPCKKDKKGDALMTFRGLDCWILEGAKSLDDNISRVVSAVMNEQDRQWRIDTDESDLIAAKSFGATSESPKVAIEMAAEDEREARSIYAMEDVSKSLDFVSRSPTTRRAYFLKSGMSWSRQRSKDDGAQTKKEKAPVECSSSSSMAPTSGKSYFQLIRRNRSR